MAPGPFCRGRQANEGRSGDFRGGFGAFRDAKSGRMLHSGNFFLWETVIFRRAVCRLNIFSYLCAPVICGKRITTS